MIALDRETCRVQTPEGLTNLVAFHFQSNRITDGVSCESLAVMGALDSLCHMSHVHHIHVLTSSRVHSVFPQYHGHCLGLFLPCIRKWGQVVLLVTLRSTSPIESCTRPLRMHSAHPR